MPLELRFQFGDRHMSKIFDTFLRNETAIKRIFARYFRRLEDVEDLSQEVFMKCFAAEMRTDIHDPKAFLLRSARNLAFSELKRKVRTTTDSIEDSGGSDVYMDEAGISAETQLDTRRKLTALSQAIASLPPRHRRAFWMRKIEDLKLAQIAARLDVSVSTAKKYVAEALLMCETHLRKQGYEPTEFGAFPAVRGGGSRSDAAVYAMVGGVKDISDSE
ncbi:RNA polymerase sigma factor [Hyphococcus lacteus]|uniref:Sigma-70 family RNA polymerase sigma factor n=1 Tax=Hyphococcus lacteus TaxID=3143536 RepID=A0ABV3Z6W7_9PROT